MQKEESEISAPVSREINETYYQQAEETRLEGHARRTSKKKKRSVSKDKVNGLRKKIRSISNKKSN